MSASTPEPPRRPLTLDFSTGPGTPGKRSRKGPPPVVVQTLNLSTPKLAAPGAEAPAPQPAPAPSRKRRRDEAPRGGAPRGVTPHGAAPGDDTRHGRPEPARGGTRLADLLDEATLARLRGGA